MSHVTNPRAGVISLLDIFPKQLQFINVGNPNPNPSSSFTVVIENNIQGRSRYRIKRLNPCRDAEERVLLRALRRRFLRARAVARRASSSNTRARHRLNNKPTQTHRCRKGSSSSSQINWIGSWNSNNNNPNHLNQRLPWLHPITTKSLIRPSLGPKTLPCLLRRFLLRACTACFRIDLRVASEQLAWLPVSIVLLILPRLSRRVSAGPFDSHLILSRTNIDQPW